MTKDVEKYIIFCVLFHLGNLCGSELGQEGYFSPPPKNLRCSSKHSMSNDNFENQDRFACVEERASSQSPAGNPNELKDSPLKFSDFVPLNQPLNIKKSDMQGLPVGNPNQSKKNLLKMLSSGQLNQPSNFKTNQINKRKYKNAVEQRAWEIGMNEASSIQEPCCKSLTRIFCCYYEPDPKILYVLSHLKELKKQAKKEIAEEDPIQIKNEVAEEDHENQSAPKTRWRTVESYTGEE